MKLLDGCLADVMLVCRNGHVLTDLLRTYPEQGLSHCDRCGAETLDHCGTCGQELVVFHLPGLVPVGGGQPPSYCGVCGAPFPWIRRPAPPAGRARTDLEGLLRRLPAVLRGLRNRVSGRPGFQVSDERDLEDLLFGLLAGYSDHVWPECRTPSYASGTRTDFLLPSEGVAVLGKQVTAAMGESQLSRQWAEDLAYYSRRRACRTLLGLVYDPEGRLSDPRCLETVWTQSQEETELRCLITH